jgi:hypothetical protein
LSMLALAAAISMSAFAQDANKSGDMGKSASGDTVTVSGWVSESGCGVKGASASHMACTKKCLAAGKKVVFVDDKEKKVWAVSNPDALKGHEGEHVDVDAHVSTDTNTIDVQKVTTSPEPAAKS